MRRGSMCLLVVWCGVVAGCGKRIPEPSGVAGAPFVSWIMMSGDSDNPDHDFACQSNPRNDCVLPASQPGAPVFGRLYVYYHPAATETIYTGSIDIGFFEGSAPSHEIQPRVTVKPDEKLGNQSIVGIVSSKPGTFDVTFDIVATSNPTGQSQPIRDRVSVAVK